MDLDEIYRHHPLSKQTILARLATQGVGADRINEWHLAIDPITELTDQNHSGGVQATLEIASLAGVDAGCTVVDIGAGLGGSARVLAEAYRCTVVAIEENSRRCADAIELTRMVGLSDRVSVRQQDALASRGDAGGVDVLWGQAAWIHFPDPDAFFDLWTPALAPGGRIAMADSHLNRPPSSAAEAEALQQLESVWGARLLPLELWERAIEKRRCTIVLRQDRTDEAIASCRRLIDVSGHWPPGIATEAEQRSWHLALSAYTDGLVRAYRLIARAV